MEEDALDLDRDIIRKAGTKCFEKMSGPGPYEIKNAPAVIREGAGLPRDLCAMTEKGSARDVLS